jgi:hypothetical protein
VRKPLTHLVLLGQSAAMYGVSPAAILNKKLAERGRETFATPGEMAGSLFDGSARANTVLSVMSALVLLGAAAVTVAGVWQIVRGERGGLEVAASGVFGLVGLMAAMAVVM